MRGRSLVHPRGDANELSSRVAELLRVRRVHSWLPLVALRRAQPRGGRGGPPRGTRFGEHPVRQGCRRGLRKVRGRALFPTPVLGYDESAGYVLISGGAPTHETAGGCSTGTGINNAGNNLTFPCPTASASYNMCQTTTRLTDASACDAITTSAFGDPHVASVTRVKFDMWKTGWSTFVQFPKDVGPNSVPGNVLPYGGDKCAPAFLQNVKMKGSMLDGHVVLVRAGPLDGAAPFDDVSCFHVSVCISSVLYHIFRGVTAVRPQLACVRDV